MTEDVVLIIFHVVIIALLAIDLGFVQKRAHFPKMKEALLWTAAWVGLALAFCGYIYLEWGSHRALSFLAGYIVEESLSVDNVFVFMVILTYFAVPKENQHRVLFWGVLSAIIMRAVFIVVGSALVAQFHWILYLLGIFLIITGLKLFYQKDLEIHPDRNPVLRFARKFFPVTPAYEGGKFFVRRDGKLHMTPLFLVLLTIETTDLAFATDSIPAIFAITQDPFIIYTSNILAVCGLRSLYFVVSGFLWQFRYLRYGLSAVLGFIGVKMLIMDLYKIPITVSIAIIFCLIAISIAASVIIKQPKETPTPEP